MIHTIILGIVQGLTEFIPVSSSGHLILAREFLTIHGNDLAFDAVLQLATILAVAVYFWKDLWGLLYDWKKLKIIILATIPAVVFGLLLEKYMETVFRNVLLVAIMLAVGSFIMLLSEYFSTKDKQLTLKNGFIIGLFQCLALIPGMSRSGMTISGGLFTGLSREEATRFSFLLSFPIILGSGLKKLLDIPHIDASLSISFVVSFLVGLGAIHFLIKFLKNHSLRLFAWYRILFACFIVYWFT
jgi:undecaprenyl-diphosphatase